MLAIALIFSCIGALQDPDAQLKAAILRNLHSSDSNVRCKAAGDVWQYELLEACPRLLELLSDRDRWVGNAAANSLEAMEFKIDPGKLLARVRDGSVSFVIAKDLLRRWAGPEEFGPLLKSLKDDECDWRDSALSLLADLKSRAAVPLALKWIDDPGHALRYEAAWYLTSLGVREAIPKLRAWALNTDEHECAVAVRCLSELGVEDSGDVILAIVQEGDKIHRFSSCLYTGGRALEQLARITRRTPPRDMLPTIEPWITAENPTLRMEAIRILGWIRHEPSVDKMKKLLSDRDARVRAEAIRALIALQAKEHVSAILGLIADPEEDVRIAVAEALRKVGGREILEPLRKLSRDKDSGVRSSAIEAIAEFAPEDCGPDLIRGLEDSSPDVSRLSIYWIQARRIPGAAPLLVSRVDSKNDGIRCAALDALLALRATEQAGEITRRLGCLEGYRLQDAAAVACSLGSRRAGEILLSEAERGESVSLAPLNALRSPKAWEKLGAVPAGYEEHSIGSLLRQGAAQAGLRFIDEPGPAWLNRKQEWGWPSLDAILCFWDDGGRIIIDPDRVRTVLPSEAIRFWKRWLAENKER